MRISMLALALALVASCSKKPAEPTTTTPEPNGEETPPPSEGNGDQRPQLTAADCEAQGGKVVGDIGDGAIHRPDYRCESGEPPIGSIVAETGGPMGVEGAVCCK